MKIKISARVLTAALLALSFESRVVLGETPEATLDLRTFLASVKAANPEIRAARNRYQAARERVLPARTWPDPRVGPNLWRIPSGKAPTPGNARMDMYTIEQDIPFPGKLAAQGKAAHHEALSLKKGHDAVELGILAQATRAYYGLWFLRELARLHQAHTVLWERFSSVSERLYASGKVSLRDVLLAQVELEKVTNDLASIKEKMAPARAKLNALEDSDPDKPLGPLVPPRPVGGLLGIMGMERKARANNPELMAAEHHVTHRRFLVKKSRLDYLPDFTAGISRMQESDGFSGYNAKLILSIPLYFWKQKALVKSARWSLREMESRRRSVRSRVGVDLREVFADVRNAARTAKLYESSILPRTRSALRVVESGYVAEKAGFLDLLEIERRLLFEELRHLQALKDYGEAAAELERITGSEFSLLTTLKEEKR